MAFSLLLVAFIVFMVGGSGSGAKRLKRTCKRKGTTQEGTSSSEPTPETFQARCDERIPGAGELPVGRNSDFRSDESFYRHHELFRHCTVMSERPIKLVDFPNSLLERVIRERNWENLVFYSERPNETLVREFYANVDLYFVESEYIHCYVRTKFFKITPQSLSMFFEAPVVHNPLFPFSDENRPSLSEVATLLTGANRVWDGIASTLKHSELTPDFAILHIFVSANLCPVFHTTTVNKDKAYMMFALATNVPIDLGSYIFKTILNAIEKSKKNSSLPFGSLITSLCKEALVRDLPSDHIVPLGPTYNRAAYNKRLTNLQRARNVPNVGVNLGNDPDENVQAPPMQDQGENAFSMENMWNLMNNISARQDELRQTMIAQFQGVNQRLDAIDDRMTFYYNRGEHTHQNVDDNIDVDLDDEDDDDDDDDDGDDE